jgi:hypothetical protein
MVASGPSFGARMSFAAALGNPATNSPGLYRIYKNGRPVYAGRAAPGTIRSRLQNHRWCLTHMAVDDSAYTVSFAPMSSSTAQVVAAEKREIRRMRGNRVFRGTNVREGEMEWMLGRESMSSDPNNLGDFLGSDLKRRRTRGGPPSTKRSAQAPAPQPAPPPSSDDGPPIPLVRRKPRPQRQPGGPPSTLRSNQR